MNLRGATVFVVELYQPGAPDPETFVFSSEDAARRYCETRAAGGTALVYPAMIDEPGWTGSLQ